MSAEENLTLRIRAHGAAQAKRELDRMKREVKDTGLELDRVDTVITNVGKSSDKTRHRFLGAIAPGNVFTRVLRIMSTRATITAVAVVALAGAFALLSPGIAMAIAGLTTLGALMGPAFLLGAVAAARFKDQVGILGSESNRLARTFIKIRDEFNKALGPAADTVLGAFADTLLILRPLIQQIAGPMQMFARSTAHAMRLFARGIVDQGPQIAALMRQLGPFMVQLARFGVALSAVFLTLATAGLPVLDWALRLLVDFTVWLQGAIVWLEKFFHSAEFTGRVATAFDLLSVAGNYLADVIHEAWGIAVQLYEALEPFLPLVGRGLIFAFEGLLEVLTFVNENFDALQHIIVPLIAFLTAYKAVMAAITFATWAWTAAQTALNFVMSMNPIVRAITIIGLLAAALVTAYNESEKFRNIVDGVWDVIKAAPGWVRQAFEDAINWIIGALNYAIDAINKAIEAYNAIPVAPDIGTIGHVGKVGMEGHLETAAAGPRLGARPWRGGATGPNRRREGVRRAAAAPVRPAVVGGVPNVFVEPIVPVTLNIDGQPAATAVARAGRRKKSTR